ncbi:hypothetical protein DERP_015057 [Dermatophagoides pteronyssinus]|uniref:Uncharacterized protein n=1 Tax=Dermatophagoides pteronyssinus TaxID=6956 RepID=A0ABQ8J5V6_DERPT|nr:hypothetical protein DERP_015057 [Dermatophagoides pteronyssinus]
MTKDCKTFVIINTNLHVNMTVNNQYKFINFIESSVNDQSDDEHDDPSIMEYISRVAKAIVIKTSNLHNYPETKKDRKEFRIIYHNINR